MTLYFRIEINVFCSELNPMSCREGPGFFFSGILADHLQTSSLVLP